MKSRPSSRSIDDENLRKAAVQLQRRLLQWYQQNKRDLPWRLAWQQFGSPYHVWVSEIMLQQTVIKAVIPAYERFMIRFPRIEDLAAASEEEVRLASRGLGYYRRFRMLHQAAQKLVADHPDCDSSAKEFWPQDFRSWQEQPGVGSYTAAAIASIAFHEAVPVVDGNVERVFCRLLDIREEPGQNYLKKAFFQLGLHVIAKSEPGNFNQALMELGQRVCSKASPQCSICPIKGHCLAFANKSQSLAPKTKTRAIATEMQGFLLIAKKRGRIGLSMRPSEARFLGGHLGFVTAFKSEDGIINWDGHKSANLSTKELGTTIGHIKHTITRFKLAMEVRIVEPKNAAGYEWLRPNEVEERLVSNLDRKAWQRYEQMLS
ncbi:MAG: A/G-specific adenine glycosylase [Oligoflexus sp.]